MAVDPTDFLLNSDYEMDKIVYFYEGSFTVTSSSTTKTISLDSLGFTPLCFGLWSTTSNFSQPRRMTSQGHGIYDMDSQSYIAPFVKLGAYETFETGVTYNHYIDLDFQNFSNNTKIYFRIYGFEPTTYTGNAPETSSNADSFVLNTDYNYRKLLKKGRVEVPHKSGIPYGNIFDPVSVNHSLGYIPQMMIWTEEVPLDANNQETTKHIYNYVGYGCLNDQLNQNGIAGLVVTNQKITYYQPGGVQVGENIYLHYRIYYDQAQ